MAELLGAYAGDGTMSEINPGRQLMSIAASKDEKGWLSHVANLFRYSFDYRPSVRWNNNVFKIQTGVKRICRFFNNMGFPSGKKALRVRAPNTIMTSNDWAIRRAFLRGFFDADGSIYFSKAPRRKYCKFKGTHHYYPKISLASISRDLICTDIRKLLSGFRQGSYKEPPGRKGKHWAYYIVLRGSNQVNLWMKTVGSSNPVHLTKYKVWKQFGFCPPRTTLDQRKAILSGGLKPETLYQSQEEK